MQDLAFQGTSWSVGRGAYLAGAAQAVGAQWVQASRGRCRGGWVVLLVKYGDDGIRGGVYSLGRLEIARATTACTRL